MVGVEGWGGGGGGGGVGGWRGGWRGGGGVGLAYHIWSLIAFPSSSIVLILKSIPGGVLVTIDFR